MKSFTFLLFLFFNYTLLAQNGPNNPLSARSNGVGNASVTFFDINSLFNNQAGLADLENIALLYSGQGPFVTPNSDHWGGGFAIPTSFGTVGSSFQYLENSDINQIKIGFTYARKLMEKLSVGVQFDILNTQIESFEKSTLYTFEIGLQYLLTEKLLLGIHLYNPAQLEIIEDEYLPNVLRVGATYFASQKIMIHVELEKDFDFPIVFKSGLEWEMINDFYLRFGFEHRPTTINMGIGYQFKNRLRLDLALHYQQGLDLISSSQFGPSGLVPNISVGFDFFEK